MTVSVPLGGHQRDAGRPFDEGHGSVQVGSGIGDEQVELGAANQCYDCGEAPMRKAETKGLPEEYRSLLYKV